jgi:hypothetical protein
MGKPIRHWWGAGLPGEFAREWSADESKRCEGEVQSLYVRKTVDGKAGWRVVGLICLGCGVVSVDEEALDFLDYEAGAG